MVLGVDVSRWNTKVDWKALKAQGVELAFIKATQGVEIVDPLLKKHVDGAGEAGMIIGVFHWDDPNHPAARQRDFFLEKTRDIPYKLVAIDQEQEWKLWSEWQAKQITQFFDPNALGVHCQAMDDAFNHGVKAPVLIYTRQTWVLSYTKGMTTWLANRNSPLWLALYPKKQAVPTIAEFPWSKHWPVNARNLKIWQFGNGSWKLPGIKEALDLDLWNGTLEELKAFCGESQEAPTPSQIPAYPAGYLGRVEKVEDQLKTLITEARAHGWKV